MSLSPEAFVYGHICKDKVPGEERFVPGSPAWYISRTLASFGTNTAVVSPRGPDYPTEWLPDILIVPDTPTAGATLIYENRYDAGGHRTQYAANAGEAVPIHPTTLPSHLFRNVCSVIVCPILDNIPKHFITSLRNKAPEAVFTLLPQGYFRDVGDHGLVTPKVWREASDIVGLFDAVIVSDQDAPGMHETAKGWSAHMDGFVVVTQAANGATVYREKSGTNVQPFPISKEVHPTGAGDVFAAALVFHFLRHRHPVRSVLYANAAGALHVAGETVTPEKIELKIQELSK